MTSSRVDAAVLALSVLVQACGGATDAREPRPDGDDDDAPPSAEACRAPAARIWKLTPEQIAATIESLLPVDTTALEQALSDTLGGANQDSVMGTPAATLGMTAPHVSALLDSADRLAEQAWSMRGELAACLAETQVSPACMSSFIEGFAALAFRRPLGDGERDELLDFWTAEKALLGEEAAWKQTVASLFVSPRFLHRTELGDPGQAGDVLMTGHEKASFIAYLLSGGPPDAELSAAATAGALESREGLGAEVRRLLASPASAPGVIDFFERLVGSNRLPQVRKDAEAFPEWNPSLATAMQAEVRRFTESVLWQDDGQLDTLLRADYTLVDDKLAAFHGGTPPPPGEVARLSLAETPRRGLLTMPGVLSVLSRDLDTATVHRGVFIRQSVLCQEVPAPPPTVNAVPIPPDGEHTRKQLLAVHSEDPTCAACHALMDPLGLALENFDAIGRVRETEAGQRIDTSGELQATSHPGSFTGPADLMALLLGQDETLPCFVKNVHGFAFARPAEEGEGCRMRQLEKALRDNDGRVMTVFETLLTDPTFYLRHNEADQP